MLFVDAANETVVVEHRLAPEQTVGALKQGLVCLPAGKIKVFQLRIPSADKLSKDLRGQSVWLSDEKLHGLITKIEISLCTSWKGIASTKPKGKISAEISWRRMSSDTAEVACVASGKISFDGDDPRSSEAPMTSVIAASLIDAKKCLGASPKS